LAAGTVLTAGSGTLAMAWAAASLVLIGQIQRMQAAHTYP